MIGKAVLGIDTIKHTDLMQFRAKNTNCLKSISQKQLYRFQVIKQCGAVPIYQNT